MLHYKQWLIEQVWLVSPNVSKVNCKIIYALRFLWIIIKGFVEDNCLLRAKALAYTTAISLVPLLAVAFSIFKGIGGIDDAKSKLEPILATVLVPESQEIVHSTLFGFIDKINATAIGGIAFIFLVISVLSLLGTIEKAFNTIWGIANSRSFFEKLTSYWTILTFGPILIIISISLSASMQSSAIYDRLITLPILGVGIAYIFTIAVTSLAFFLLYLYMPNTKVRIIPAFIGSVCASILFEGAKLIFALYIKGVMAPDSPMVKIYGGFISLPIFLLWIWLIWLIVLLGSEISFAWQNMQSFEFEGRSTKANFNSGLFTGLLLCAESAKEFYGERRNWDSQHLSELYCIPVRLLNEISERLVVGGILAYSDRQNKKILIPAIDPAKITVTHIHRVLAEAGFDAVKNCDFNLLSGMQALLNQPQTTLKDYSKSLKSVGGNGHD